MSLAIRDLPSPNQDARPENVPIDTIVLHYTGMRSAREAIERLRDPAARVSSHYVVDEDGAVLRLVAEERRAWHAGVSYWRGHRGLNDRSIGIEIVNPGHEWGYRNFPVLQLAAVCDLCLAIFSRHPIPQRNVVAHSDISPDRKEDPGEKFDWEQLALSGVGLWPHGTPDTGTGAPVRDAASLAPGPRRPGGNRLRDQPARRPRPRPRHHPARLPTPLAPRSDHRPGQLRHPPAPRRHDDAAPRPMSRARCANGGES